MHCANTIITYTIRPNDTLHQLAKEHNTTVMDIMSRNPSIDPYNLQIGSQILICPGNPQPVFPPVMPEPPIGTLPPTGVVPPLPPIGMLPPRPPVFPPIFPPVRPPVTPVPPIGTICPDMSKRIALINLMRLVWSQHVYWTRMLLLSIAHRLPDQTATTNRLMQNPGDIAAVFGRFYNRDAAKKIADLLTEHLNIGGQIMVAVRDGNTAETDRLNKAWHRNADEMALAFANLNSHYGFNDLKNMLYKHLELTTKEVSNRMAGNFPADIAAFDEVEKEALDMADYFTSGLIKEFPNQF
ncbi:MAG: LysM peptidoglycan-binding domain-containing protein [Firmicutes bacterium]|nr:LysM peptidoglycan-binding domain-containing protein [Bacillota bacterium]